MDRLPLEIVQDIFFCIDDFDTLRSVTLTCRYLHAAFTSREKLIATQVLVNQIGWDVLPEAIVVDESSRLGAYDSQKAMEFSNKHLGPRMTSLSEAARWNLVEALPLVRLHKTVEFLAKRFADDIWNRTPVRDLPLLYRDPDYEPFEMVSSPKSLYRIERALYRFQLYWNIFRFPSARVEFDTQWDIYFRVFNVWENEQLACAYYHLFKIINDPFSFYRHTYRPDHRDEEDFYYCHLYSKSDCGAQYLLSQGLEYIYRIATTEPAYARKLMMDTVLAQGSPNRLPVTNNLYKSLRRPYSLYVELGSSFEELADEGIRDLVENPYCNDNNCSAMVNILEKTYDLAYTLDESGIEHGGASPRLEYGYAFWDWVDQRETGRSTRA